MSRGMVLDMFLLIALPHAQRAVATITFNWLKKFMLNQT